MPGATESALKALLAQFQPAAALTDTWGAPDGTTSTAYLSPEPPPDEHVVGARGIVFRHADGGTALDVLVMDTAVGPLICPGGGREAGETPEETFRRELREESGWTVANVRPIGFIHIQRLGTWSPDARRQDQSGQRYPYARAGREFLWAMFVAEAAEHWPDTLVPNVHEVFLEIAFRPVAVTLSFQIDNIRRFHQRLFLNEVVNALA